ncbi:MAG: HlyD family efflux transporter periplasmic adaptor subunit [Proteobacteria bacterium]|nr:HlyD family efflux transporter periplasmic adaptor subunit [Pseudomonadota bacterium]
MSETAHRRLLTADNPAKPSARRQSRKNRRTAVKWLKRVVLTAAAGGLAASSVVAFLPKPIPVDLTAATRGRMTVTVDEDGKTRVKDRYIVSAPLSGNIPRLGLLPGDSVAESQILTRIVPVTPPLLDARTRAEARARLASAQASRRQALSLVERVRALHQQAQREVARQRPLAARGAVSESIAERAEYELRATTEDLRSAEFGVKVANQEVASARAALGLLEQGTTAGEPHLELPSPTSGQVLRVFRQDEGLVQAATRIIELGDPASLEVVADVLTRDAVQIRPGAPVAIVRWGGDSSIRGHVRRVEPSAFTRISALGVEEQRVNVIVDIDDPREQWSALGDGYRVEVAIEVWNSDDVLSVPASSVFRQGDRWAVYRVDNAMTHLTPVKIGRRNERRVQIVEGLDSGTQVVLHPSDQVTHGVEVISRGP